MRGSGSSPSGAQSSRRPATHAAPPGFGGATSLAARKGDALELRYEDIATDPARVASELARHLGAPEEPLVSALGRAHAESVGRYRTDLTAEQLADIEDEAGSLLRELGYL